MKSRNTITLALMVVSITLLLMLQGLWLQNSYEKTFYDLRRDANFLFRSTLFTVRDSLFAKNFKPLHADSLLPERIESISVFKSKGADSMRIRMKSSTVQVFVSGDVNNNTDSLVRALQPMTHLKQPMREGRSFIFTLSPDTLSLDTLTTIFTKALEVENLPVKFFLETDFTKPESMTPFRTRMVIRQGELDTKEKTLNVYRDTLRLDAVQINPVARYSASLLDFRGFILREITPQILFSLFLTAITITAFFVLYRNLRIQQRLMEQKNDFISNVTHELKTPVATVSVALEALKNFHGLDNPQRTKEYLDIAQNELNRLTLMTDKILKASAFESNDVEIQKELVDLKKTIELIIESMKLVFDKHHAEVTFHSEGEKFSVRGSSTHLTNVIYNLIDNALKYSPQQPKMMITLAETGSQLVLSVQDNGMGISAEYQKKIFEKFFRVPTGDVHNIKGYGLGLSYVASVVKSHEGTIEVTSSHEKGSCFTITLPK